MPPPFPTKEFCVSSGDEASACMEEQHEAGKLVNIHFVVIPFCSYTYSVLVMNDQDEK